MYKIVWDVDSREDVTAWMVRGDRMDAWESGVGSEEWKVKNGEEQTSKSEDRMWVSVESVSEVVKK